MMEKQRTKASIASNDQAFASASASLPNPTEVMFIDQLRLFLYI